MTKPKGELPHYPLAVCGTELRAFPTDLDHVYVDIDIERTGPLRIDDRALNVAVHVYKLDDGTWHHAPSESHVASPLGYAVPKWVSDEAYLAIEAAVTGWAAASAWALTAARVEADIRRALDIDAELRRLDEKRAQLVAQRAALTKAVGYLAPDGLHVTSDESGQFEIPHVQLPAGHKIGCAREEDRDALGRARLVIEVLPQ